MRATEDERQEETKIQKMTTDKSRRKLNSRIYRHLIFGVVCVIILSFGSVLPVEAVPATLDSASVVIYEQPGEWSTPVGNLVQDGAFEYLGDVTAEDGSVWRSVSAGGISGYIKGDAVIRETGGTQEVSEESNGAPEDGHEAESTEAPVAPAADNRETEPEDEDETEETTALTAQTVQNNRTKTYATETSGGKIKEQENSGMEISESNAGSRTEAGKVHKIDGTLLMCIIIAFFSITLACIFGKKLKQIKKKTRKDGRPESLQGRNCKKNDKKKRKSRHRKNRKTKKESVKKQRIN